MNFRPTVLVLAILACWSAAHARNPEPTTAATWKVKSGDTLTHIANSRYGSDAYTGFLEAFNKVKPRKLFVDMKLGTPDFSDALEKCKATTAAPKVAPALGKFADQLGIVSKAIAKSRKDASAPERFKPLSKELLEKMSQAQKQAAAVQSTVSESKLPKSLGKSLDERFGKIDKALTELLEFEKEKDKLFHVEEARSMNRIHYLLDGALREMIDYAHKPYE